MVRPLAISVLASYTNIPYQLYGAYIFPIFLMELYMFAEIMVLHHALLFLLPASS
jgi:hypothetical protein